MILSVFLNWFLTVRVPTMLSWFNISYVNSLQCLVYFWQGWSIYCHRSMTRFYSYHVLPSSITPLVSRRCLAIAPHLTNFVEVMSFLVVITLLVLDCCQPRTPTSEIIPHYKSNTPSILLGNFELNLVIPILSAASRSCYLWLCYLVLLWCTDSSVCEHNLRQAFNIMLLVLKGNFGSELASYILIL